MQPRERQRRYAIMAPGGETMFCPGCGAEDRTRTQFCRSCGAELHAVRSVIEKTETHTRAAAAAREEIRRAIADKIEEINSASDLKLVVEHVLPQIENFLESPAERRLRQVRGGIITASVGLALILFFLLLAILTRTPEVLIAGGAGLIVLVIGLGILASSLAFSRLAPHVEAGNTAPTQLPPRSTQPRVTGGTPGFVSITEGTTREFEHKSDSA